MACWLEQASSNTELCDAIDEIMKQEHEDILIDQTLSPGTPLDMNLETFSEMLDSSQPISINNGASVSPISPVLSTTTNDYSATNNVYDIPTKSYSRYSINNSQNSSTAPNYSALGISPQFTNLTIHQQHHPYLTPAQDNKNNMKFPPQFVPSNMTVNGKTISHPPPYLQQHNTSALTNSYGFDPSMNSGQSDVKRFRSASMNEGPTQPQPRLDQQSLDPYRMRSLTYAEPSYCYNKGNSSANTTMTTTSSASSVSTDISNNAWPCSSFTRPISTSFSEVLDHQRNQQQQNTQALSCMPNNLSSSYEGSPSLYSLNRWRNQGTYTSSGLTFQNQLTPNCTLYSLNQQAPINGRQNSPTSPVASSSVTRKTGSLAGFPVEEIKDDPISPHCPIDQQNDADLWSDIEPQSSDHIPDFEDDDLSSDDETATTVSAGFKADFKSMQSAANHFNPNLPFWQYNVQAKGPKTKRILYLKERDPHLSREFSDPVYQLKLSQTRGQPLSKLRKGDGNDVTPNPTKLYQLGKQIRDLSTLVGKNGSHTTSVYHGIYHFDPQTNANDSAEVKKEKNKIASRACRLRKKAQHEANKLKLHGLNEEHRTLIDLITSIKLLMLKRCQDGKIIRSPSPNQSLEAICSQMIASKYNQRVAGNTDGFVQKTIIDMENLYASKTERSQSLNT